MILLNIVRRLYRTLCPYESQQVTVLSTGHISESDADLLRTSDFASAASEYGWFILCNEDTQIAMDGQGFSPEFLSLLKEVNRYSDYLLLDRDGPIYPNLSTYDW